MGLSKRKLARQIARDLFTDGMGQRGARLVLELPGENLGHSGWSEKAAADRIFSILEGKVKHEKTG